MRRSVFGEIPECNWALAMVSGLSWSVEHEPPIQRALWTGTLDHRRKRPNVIMILGLRTYPVQRAARQPLIEFMVKGLQSAGCRILFASDAGSAPFIITAETSTGERLGIVAYAFLATCTPTRNRPPDERSFQIKYGGKQKYIEDNNHEIWQDPFGLFTTLLIGIDTEDKFFVAADPAMHNPTKFFIRLEFKDRDAQQIKNRSWHAWERERLARDGFTEPVEVLVGGTQDRFLDLVRFERAASRLAPGDRQLLAERPEYFTLSSASPVSSTISEQALHPLSREFNLSPDQIMEVIANARRLKMAVRGWVAERHLKETLERTPGVTQCELLDIEGGADVLVRYRDGQPLTIECKNVLRKTTRLNEARVDFQRTRAAKRDPCSRYYRPADFHVLAACLHAVTEQWEFRYISPRKLPPHPKCEGRLASNVNVGPAWSSDPVEVFRAIYSEVQ
jgi:hypothetical protein